MLKKVVVLFAMVASLVFADDSMYGYSSPYGSNPYGTSNETTYASAPVYPIPQETDYRFSLAFHPMGTIIYKAAMDVFGLWVSFEAGFGSSFSLITRPVILNGTYHSTTITGYGLTEGFRFYLSGRGHRGWYIEPEIQYASLEGSREGEQVRTGYYSYSTSSAHAEASGFGVYVLFGYKVQNGHFVFGIDGGVGLNFVSASGSSDNSDIEDIRDGGFGTDFNMYLGFAF